MSLIVAYRQVSKLYKAFVNNSSGNIKLSKSQLSKKVQSEGFFGWLHGPLLKTGLPLMKNEIRELAKSVFISLTTVTLATM